MMLQWGRARVSAESLRARVAEMEESLLQWGRARVSAERICTGVVGVNWMTGFNGAALG